MTQEYDIFISYANQDSKVVHEYARELENEGYKVWYDQKYLSGGVNFTKVISNAISNSKLVIFFSSQYSNKSEWTEGEIFLARECKKPILPIKLDDADYKESLKLILLPLHYIECKSEATVSHARSIIDAVEKLFGSNIEPRCRVETDKASRRSCSKICIAISALLSIIFTISMLKVSGQSINRSLSLFTMTVSVLGSFLSGLYIIRNDKRWHERTTAINIAYITGITFFISYTIMALGLGYGRIRYIKLNLPSIICSIASIWGLVKLMNFKKIGYRMLWICMTLFSIGSYWWLNHRLNIPICIASIGTIIMLTLTAMLRHKGKGISMWKRLS